MNSSRAILLVTFLLLFGLSVSSQTPVGGAKLYDKEGLSFNYPTGWQFNDTSSKNAIEMTFGREDLDATVKVFVFRTPLDSADKLAEAKKILVERYITTTTKSFEDENGHPKGEPSTSEIAALKAEGVKIHASLDGVAGVAEIEWAIVQDHMVVLTLFGPDKAVKMAAPAWDLIRSSIKIAAPPTPAATPKKPRN